MKIIRIFSAILCIAALSTTAIAATTEDAAKQAFVTVSLELNKVSVANAFQEIATMANLTVIYEDDGAYFAAKK